MKEQEQARDRARTELKEVQDEIEKTLKDIAAFEAKETVNTGEVVAWRVTGDAARVLGHRGRQARGGRAADRAAEARAR